VEVVPLTVTIDGRPFLEGVDLDADAFYEHFRDGQKPEVATAAPSPGQFSDAYRKLVDRGATEILSVHIGSSISGTLNAARLAAGEASVPVRLVDTGTASFGIACCLWEAAEAVAKGADLEEAAAVALEVAGRVGSVFVVGALDLARAGGRMNDAIEGVTKIPVLSMVDGTFQPVAEVATLQESADVMAERTLAWGTNLRVGLSIADAGAAPLWHALEQRLVDAPNVIDIVRYRVGPSVGVHTGPGTAGAMYYPALV
jgi:DegV family protein with EDD domain